MPTFPHLSQQEKEALVAYLFGEPKQTIRIAQTGLGKKIFKSNCASCHRATTHDPKPSGIRCMEPAPLAGATKRFTKQEIFNLVKSGVCYMPAFDHFTKAEKQSLWTYLKTLEGKGEPARPTMGEVCPMIKSVRAGQAQGSCCSMMN